MNQLQCVARITNPNIQSGWIANPAQREKAQGDVILGQGNITLQADYVEIKNSTTVPLGTTLFIGN